MESNTNITQIIIETINTLFDNLFSSIDNQLYNLLDNLVFINSDILKDSYFQDIFGKSASSGILLLCNSLLFALILYYNIEHPFSFIFKCIIYGIFMNSSFFIIQLFLDLISNSSLFILSIGQNLFKQHISFSSLISNINSQVSINMSSLNIFTVDGLIKSILSFSLLNLVFSYSLRYILIKVFILLTPLAFLSLIFSKTSWFFNSWLKNIFSLLFLQIIVSIILLLMFSIPFSDSSLLNKCIYIGGMYALIQANTIVKEFIGGLSTTISQNVESFKKISR